MHNTPRSIYLSDIGFRTSQLLFPFQHTVNQYSTVQLVMHLPQVQREYVIYSAILRFSIGQYYQPIAWICIIISSHGHHLSMGFFPSNPNHYSIIYLLPLLVYAYGVQSYPIPVLRYWCQNAYRELSQLPLRQLSGQKGTNSIQATDMPMALLPPPFCL